MIKELARIRSLMAQLDPTSSEYAKLVENYRILSQANDPSLIEGLRVFAQVASIVLVLNYERLGVVTSKAFGIIKR